MWALSTTSNLTFCGSAMPYTVWNNSQPSAIFRGTWPSKFNLLGQIYYTFSMGNPIIVYKNVPTLVNGQPISNPYFKPCHKGLQKCFYACGLLYIHVFHASTNSLAQFNNSPWVPSGPTICPYMVVPHSRIITIMHHFSQKISLINDRVTR